MTMPGTSFRDMLEDVKTSGPAEVDTSFLDEYRRTGTVPKGGQDNAAPHRQGEEPAPGQYASEPEVIADEEMPTREPEVDSFDRDAERERDDDAHRPDEPKSLSAGSRGGSGISGAAPSGSAAHPVQGEVMAPVTAPPPPPPVGDDSDADLAEQLDKALDAEDVQRRDHDRMRDISAARKSDQRDAIQGAASGVKGGASNGTGDSLPESGFRLLGAESQLMVRNLPFPLMEAMREQLRSGAVRERGVSDSTARGFSKRLSQPALVAAFLLAHFDVRIDTDQATRTAVELFRSQDPLLGSVVERMDALERRENDHSTQLQRLQEALQLVHETSAAIEQAVAYSIADRTENFLRGSHNIHDAPITHKDAIYVRDKVRDETRKRAKFEKDRDGKPIR
ncbi:hypothetical protein [Arthrobacter bambusae]|uniref:DUF222 domain-containing protein n=1 Tax=Arthrobacter bambusae TaxID=1338426 RepID=A0AAW8DHF1_9MICC|nr:hypothetical protein [Arthrobacter bambusae]MDP9904589.1 hypothetical protein [Arthrobacter bambusae]MDQ0129405.1 hypothetical protein [Arthrobacter bambusae]MDQ0180982.1 hypothetical protein [Arthrobacter bambusae]